MRSAPGQNTASRTEYGIQKTEYYLSGYSKSTLCIELQDRIQQAEQNMEYRILNTVYQVILKTHCALSCRTEYCLECRQFAGVADISRPLICRLLVKFLEIFVVLVQICRPHTFTCSFAFPPYLPFSLALFQRKVWFVLNWLLLMEGK